VLRKKDYALRHPYQTHVKTKIMSNIEQVQEQMMTEMEAMKEQITMMMEAIMSMRKMMNVNAATAVSASTATERDTIHSPDFNQVSCPVSNVVGQGGEAETNAYRPYYVQVHSMSSFPPYGLPPNYTPPTIVSAPGENIGNSTPIFIKSQQPQLDHTPAHVSQPIGKHIKLPKTTL